MSVAAQHISLSHTRAAPLGNLAGLCLVLRECANPMSVSALAQAAVDRSILEDVTVVPGERLPTRVNHHMIALRELQLVVGTSGRGHAWYDLTPTGRALAEVAEQVHDSAGPLCLDDTLRACWRPILVHSDYVRHQWLKYYMSRADFTYPELLSEGTAVSVQRLPLAERDGADDSGYRIVSDHWGEWALDALGRREIYEGLRRWTNEAYLTDDLLPLEVRGPFLHLGRDVHGLFEGESHVVKAWLSPENDLELFDSLVQQVMKGHSYGNRIGIPELIIALCEDYHYAKQNVKDMLVALYYRGNDRYSFERASRFLMRRAFADRKSDDYYVQIEGVWRTGLVYD